ncbi:MAG: hypothetical protein E7231_04470 [Cellulosilyticum sp.]|nr:hypothetical protein [Cellulosilyticum sp.]
MNKQIKTLIYVIMAISLVACGFIGFQRIQTEESYTNVETAVKYSDILRIAIEEDRTVEEVLSQYKELGITTLLVREMAVASAVDRDYSTYKGLGDVNLVDGYILRFSYPEEEEIRPELRYIVTEEEAVADNIFTQFSVRGIDLPMYEIEGRYYLEIGDHGVAITTLGVGFDVEMLNVAADMGYNISLQIKSWDEPTDEAMQFLMDEIASIKNVRTIYFADAKVPGVNNVAFQEFLQNYQLGFIEFTSTKQEGFTTLAKKISNQGTDYKVVRLHTIEDNKLATTSIDSLIERYDLALKERSNRVFLFKLPDTEDLTKDIAYLDESITTFIKDATDAGYTITDHVENYNLKTVPAYLTVITGLAAIMVFILFMDALGFVKTGYILAALGFLGYIALLKISPTKGCQLMALFGSIMFPTYALVKCLDSEAKNIKETILTLLKICVISFGGVLTIIGCLSRTNFALALDVFLGVKVATVVPIGLVIGYLIFKAHRFDFKYYKGLLDQKISYGSLILIALLAVVLYVYVSRTGNTGTATGFERSFRQFLDNVLGVRPRTKEFLISYPILMALLYYGYKERYIVAVILAVIGPVSLVNTYAHIHTPVLISLIRSGYGIIFGILIGILFIGVIKLIGKVIKKCQTQLK